MRDPVHTFKKRTYAQKINISVGIVFIFLGAVGLLYPGFAGGHFSLTMNFLHILSGLIAFSMGTAKQKIYAYWFCIAGLVFTGMLGIAGLVLGEPGMPTVGFSGQDPMLWVLLPKLIELGVVDHVINLVLGGVFLSGVVSYRRYHHRTIIKVSSSSNINI